MRRPIVDFDSLTDADEAYQVIKSRIISLELPPGFPISQPELMEELEVSRTPIREALKRLENESLVVAIHRRGMSVAEIALNDLRYVYEIRVELEAACARLAASRATAAQIRQLEQVLDQLLNTDLNDRRLVAERECQLHFLISECSHSRFLTKELQHYYALALRIWYFLIDRLPPGCEDIEAHIKVVDAIRNRESKLSEKLMQAHVKAVFETVKAHL
jgi:DNA-binding GntR family transcriptional regulator